MRLHGDESAHRPRQRRRVVLEVRDTGVGITAEELPLVFERFYRADKARARGKDGFGLGLSICQALVNAHGGEIRLESQPGQGTTVTTTLPACAPPQGNLTEM
jgi:signal transduction histidine kinase